MKNSIWEDAVQLADYRSLASLAGSYVTLSTSTEVRTQHEFERMWCDAVRSLPVASEPDRAKLKWHKIFIAIWHGTALKPVLMPFTHEGTKPVKETRVFVTASEP